MQTENSITINSDTPTYERFEIRDAKGTICYFHTQNSRNEL